MELGKYTLFLLIPTSVHDVVVGDSVDHILGLLGRDILDFFCRNAGVEASWFYDRAAGHEGVGRNDGVLSDDRAV